MKNMKKVVAALSATAVMAMGVSAFAAATNATYENGAASITLSDLSDQQLTVIIIDADKADDTLAAEDLYYINQGEDGETFWTNMGTKVDLATLVEEGKSKDFIMRIGGENLSSVKELTFTISKSSAGVEVQLGDANQYDGVEILDVIAILNHLSGKAEYELTGINAFAADANQYDGIEILDVIAVLNHLSGKAEYELKTANYIAE